MEKKPILINSVFLVDMSRPHLRSLCDALEDEQRYFNIRILDRCHGHVTVRIEVRKEDQDYFANLISAAKAGEL